MKDYFNEIDNLTEAHNEIIKAPFGWPGGKGRSLKHILPLLPYRGGYVEPFGGSGVVLINRRKSSLEVFNDRYSGVVDFYRCLRSRDLFPALLDWIEYTVHSREEFQVFKESWKDLNDPIERAGRWYYMIQYSFGKLGRNWGRATTPGSNVAGNIRKKLPHLDRIHQRLLRVQMENRDALTLLKEYDSKDTVFYLDPPYVDAYRGTYKHEMTIEDHRSMLHIISEMEGFVAISGFSNPLYDGQDFWSDRYEWKAFTSIEPMNPGSGANKDHKNNVKRGKAVECLWIKE